MKSTAFVLLAVILLCGSVRELWLKRAWLKDKFRVPDDVVAADADITTTTTTATTSTSTSTTSTPSTSAPALLPIAVLLVHSKTTNASDEELLLRRVLVSAWRAREFIVERPDVWLLVRALDELSESARRRLSEARVQLRVAALPLVQTDRVVGDDFRRLAAFKMVEYRRVVVLETRVLLQGRLRELIELPASIEFIYVRGKPIHPSFFIAVPSAERYAAFERERGWVTATHDVAHYLSWYFGIKRPIRCSVAVSDCHYLNHEPAWCGDTPPDQVTAFLFDDTCPDAAALACLAGKQKSAINGQCRHARDAWLETAAQQLGEQQRPCAN
jgi:hypothetical protein